MKVSSPSCFAKLLLLLLWVECFASGFSAERSIGAAAMAAADLSRDIPSFRDWAVKNGIRTENGFQILHSNGDCCVQLVQDAMQTHQILHVPSHILWSSAAIRQEFLEVTSSWRQLQAALEHLKYRKCQHQSPQFFLFLKLLQEVEKGSDSRWYAWLQSLPRSFDTAISMDEFELECLPPFAWSLAQIQRINLEAFVTAVQMFEGEDLLKNDTKMDTNLLHWAFNVIFTRSWGAEEDDDNMCDSEDFENARVDIVPMGDMFNHGDPAQVYIFYDKDGDCSIRLKEDVAAGTSLCLSYGRSTNPSRFLSVFGFVDESQPSIFCQILVNQPSQRHKDMGYDNAKMVFSTSDGTIAEEVWDTVLYSILEQAPQIQEAFYQAHVQGNLEAKCAIRRQFSLETGIMIRRHVDGTLTELKPLLKKVDDLGETAFGHHPRLALIQRHNAFIYRTFSRVKARLDETLKAEADRRKLMPRNK